MLGLEAGLLTNEGHSGGHVERLRLGARQMWVGLVTWLDWQCCEGKLGMVCWVRGFVRMMETQVERRSFQQYHWWPLLPIG